MATRTRATRRQSCHLDLKMIYTYDVRVTTGRDQARKTPGGKAKGPGAQGVPDGMWGPETGSIKPFSIRGDY